MESKITLRDIFSYFLVGFYFLACLASTPMGGSENFLGFTDVSKFLCGVAEASKEVSTALLLLVPLVYLTGVIVHGVDNMVQIAAMLPFGLSITNKGLKEGPKPSNVVQIALSLFLGSWVSYRAELKSSQEKSGGDAMNEQGLVYWMIAFQANEGLYRVSWLYALYHMCFTQDWLKVGIFLFLVLLFWLRGFIIITEDLRKVFGGAER